MIRGGSALQLNCRQRRAATARAKKFASAPAAMTATTADAASTVLEIVNPLSKACCDERQRDKERQCADSDGVSRAGKRFGPFVQSGAARAQQQCVRSIEPTAAEDEGESEQGRRFERKEESERHVARDHEDLLDDDPPSPRAAAEVRLRTQRVLGALARWGSFQFGRMK